MCHACSVLVAGGDNLTLRQRPALIKQLEEERKKLEQEHAAAEPPPQRWEADSAAFVGAVGELAETEIMKIAGELEVGWLCVVGSKSFRSKDGETQWLGPALPYRSWCWTTTA
jgi:hypothetical protein